MGNGKKYLGKRRVYERVSLEEMLKHGGSVQQFNQIASLTGGDAITFIAPDGAMFRFRVPVKDPHHTVWRLSAPMSGKQRRRLKP